MRKSPVTPSFKRTHPRRAPRGVATERSPLQLCSPETLKETLLKNSTVPSLYFWGHRDYHYCPVVDSPPIPTNSLNLTLPHPSPGHSCSKYPPSASKRYSSPPHVVASRPGQLGGRSAARPAPSRPRPRNTSVPSWRRGPGTTPWRNRVKNCLEVKPPFFSHRTVLKSPWN